MGQFTRGLEDEMWDVFHLEAMVARERISFGVDMTFQNYMRNKTLMRRSL
ncbi:hypothetical protein Lalb_Chr08g0236701 [Lupinus albus]|uniref:Uncharacterized protein n=1 Tax=Lupinus albus TaxID=3870 RepID=A0A6A4Q434_LUPAL|nr:hypothetical protein Lalb_Chr08g0236701 [Lupinus albus]